MMVVVVVRRVMSGVVRGSMMVYISVPVPVVDAQACHGVSELVEGLAAERAVSTGTRLVVFCVCWFVVVVVAATAAVMMVCHVRDAV